MDKANQAEMYLMTKQTDRAWEVIRELENNPLKDDQYLSQTYYIHALLLMQEGKADSACAYARRSIEYSSRYNAPENEANAMKNNNEKRQCQRRHCFIYQTTQLL